MAVSYNKLWKLMIDKKINKSQFKKMKISSITMVNMTNDEIVVLTILEKYALNLNAIYLML